MERIRELRKTLLPVPVDPAMSKCGIWARSETRLRPMRSLPSASVSFDGELTNSADSICSRSAMVWRCALGTSMPTVDFPGMRSIRMDSAFSARQRSSARPVMRLYLMPASGLSSYVVTTGPGLICVMRPPISNSWHFCSMACAHSLSSSSSIFSLCGAGRSRSGEGRRNDVAPLAMRGDPEFFGADFFSSGLLNTIVCGRSDSLRRASVAFFLLNGGAGVDFGHGLLGDRRAAFVLDLFEALAHALLLEFLLALLAPVVVALLQRADEIQFAERPAQRVMRFDEGKFRGQK